MKVALCFYGQPRDILKYKSFIDPNIDIFVHVYWRKEWSEGQSFVSRNAGFRPPQLFDKDCIKIIKQEYKPKRILIEDDRMYDDYIQKTYYDDNEFIWKGSEIDRAYKQLISVKKCNQLMKEYEIENGFKYDCIIISRFDFFLKKDIDVSVLDLNYIHVFNIKWNPRGSDKNWVDDLFFIGNNRNIDKLSNVVDYIKEHSKLHPNFTGQNGLIAYYLMKENIEYKTSFEYGKDGGLFRDM